MVESAFSALFTLMLHFRKIEGDAAWDELPEVRKYANSLASDPVVRAARCPDYNQEFDRFFNYFGSAFKLNAMPVNAN